MPEDDLRASGFNRIIDHYLATGTMSSEAYASLTPRQKDVVQCIKRAFARLGAR